MPTATATGCRWEFDAIGTRWSIDTTVELTALERADVRHLAETYDRTWSRFRDDSLPAALRRTVGPHPLPAEAAALFDLYDELHELTGGAVTPCIGDAVEHLGYDTTISLAPRPGTAETTAWSEVERTADSITAPRPFVLDVGAAGKGQLVDLVHERLRAGHDQLTVDGSGDLRHSGAPVRVALEHPDDPRLAVGVVELADAAVAASATNRRAWGDGLHHVVDGRTGAPAREVVATWAVAPDALTADALATALFFVEPDVLEARFDFAWVVIDHRRRARWSPALTGEVFT